jgi:2-polyprenyl-3-methyl-5-hydroxy-6-metoxy-1,4-benzoquinol methylase
MPLPMSTEEAKSRPLTEKERFYLQAKALWDKRWKNAPATFSPMRQSRSRQHFQLCTSFLTHMKLEPGAKVIDLGCGQGELLKALDNKGYTLEGLDISSIPLHALSSIKTYQEGLPETSLPSAEYDLVICTEVIGELPPIYHRLLFSECARLLKTDGMLLFSSALDIDSISPLTQLHTFFASEFDLLEHHLHYHMWQLRLKRLLKSPIFRYFTKPLLGFVEQNAWFLRSLEKLCQQFKGEEGISQVTYVGRKRNPFKRKSRLTKG